MQYVVDETLNVDRVDVTTGNPTEPMGFYVTMLGTTVESKQACLGFAEAVYTMINQSSPGDAPRIHCSMHAIDRNAATVFVTDSGWARWKKTIANRKSDAEYRELFSNDMLRIFKSYLTVHGAEGTHAKIATLDVCFSTGVLTHWSGCA